mmetsp:Transcript_5994/g.7772  ORF Transcript_5994/g.7772 Transcript_5994/m.7772 type:complete len:202 (+) Transcript_5994:83-688(+)
MISGFFCDSGLILDDSFLLRDVKPSVAFSYIKQIETFKGWTLGGDCEESANWSSKRPFNVNAVSCSMSSKQTSILGKVTILWEINEEIKDKLLKCTYRMVTFSNEDTDKNTLINQPTLHFKDEFRFIPTENGTIVRRICNNYINYGTFPIFIDQWVVEENMALIRELSSQPDSEYETSKQPPSGMDFLAWVIGGGSPESTS